MSITDSGGNISLHSVYNMISTTFLTYYLLSMFASGNLNIFKQPLNIRSVVKNK